MYSVVRAGYDPALLPERSRATMKWVLIVAAVAVILYFVRTRRNGR